MKTTYISIRGFGPHTEDTEFYFENAPIVSIMGPNGSGKTFILEAAFACLYGEFPSRPGSLYDNMTLGATEGLLYAEFVHDGEAYRAERALRKTGSTTSQKANLWKISGEVKRVIAGPKVRDFDAAIETLIGSKRRALASWFAAQGGSGDLCSASPADRRRVFEETLGLDRLTSLSEMHKERASELRGVVDCESRRLAGFDAESSRETLAGLIKQRATLAREKSDAENRLAFLAKEVEKLAARAKEMHSKKAEIAVFWEKRRALESQIAAKDKEHDDLSKRIAAKEAEVAKLPESDDDPMDLLREIEALESRKDSADSVRELISERDTIKAMPGFSPGVAMKSEQLEATRKLLKVLEQRRRDAEREQEDIERAIGQHDARIAELRAQIEAGTPDTPGPDDVCKTCPLMPDMGKLRSDLEDEQRAKREALKSLSEIESPPTDEEIESVRAAIEVAAIARRDVDAALAKRVRLESIEADLAALGSPEWTDADAKALRDLKARHRLASDAQARKSIEQVVCDLMRQQQSALDDVMELRDKHVEIVRASSELPSLSDHQASIGIIESQQAEASKNSDAARDELEDIKAQLRDNERSAETIQAEIDANQKASEQLAEKEGALRKHEKLQTIFGPKGVQPLIIDAAVPALEEIANELMRAATGGKMQLRVLTQSANKDGSLREDFVIAVRDRMGERDVATFSGGERRMIQTVLRIAQCLWHGRLTGTPIRQLFIDESFDALDAQNVDNLLNLLAGLSDRLQVVVVTHSEDIARRLPKSIHLSQSTKRIAA